MAHQERRHIRLAREQMLRFQEFLIENDHNHLNQLTLRKKFFSRFNEVQATYNILRETIEWADLDAKTSPT